MSFVFSCIMFFLSFTPLWFSIMFIDAVSIWTNQYCVWTEVISICCIVVGLLAQSCYIIICSMV